LGELIFATDRVTTRYRGDRGVAAWAPSYDAINNCSCYVLKIAANDNEQIRMGVAA
jgi:hypothetical protein